MHRQLSLRVAFTCVWLLLGLVQQAGATQAHVEPEGLFAHQIAHLFFVISMGILIFWLREWQLVRESGWRLVQYSALFFILWNMDAIIVHYLDERGDIYRMINAGSWQAAVELPDGSGGLALVYYIAKLDHLLCVPAVVLLFAGLRQLLQQARQAKPVDRES